MKYLKLPLLSPGLKQVRKGFWVGSYTGGQFNFKTKKLEGALYPDGLIIGCIFLFACRWAYNWGGL